MTTVTTRRSPLRRAATALLAGVALTAAAAAPTAGEARAEGPVTGDGKGIVGGALLGAEIVTIPMGIAGVEAWWPYVVFGGVGAVGGGLAGFGVESADPPAEAPLYMLAGGLALMIPAIVVSLDATTFEDYDDATDPSAEPPAGEPGATPAPGMPAPEGGATFQIQSRRRAPAPGRQVASLVGVGGGAVQLGVPAVAVAPLYTRDELVRYGVQQGTEVTVPVVGGAF